MIRVSRNFADIDNARRNLVTRDDMAAVGALVRRRIEERTARGVDASGQPFAAYSDGYGKRKREKMGASGVPDLYVSGGMLGAITIEVRPDGKAVSLFFAR